MSYGMPPAPGGGSLPYGTPGPRDTTVCYACTNEDCDSEGDVWEVEGINDLGTWEPYDDDQINCRDCGKEGEPQ